MYKWFVFRFFVNDLCFGFVNGLCFGFCQWFVFRFLSMVYVSVFILQGFMFLRNNTACLIYIAPLGLQNDYHFVAPAGRQTLGRWCFVCFFIRPILFNLFWHFKKKVLHLQQN
jgi:hypothetical protein